MKLPQNQVFKAPWKFPHHVKKWLKKNIEGYSLHVCAGSSDIGDVLCDIEPQRHNIKQVDMFHLDKKFKHNTFDTVICDPPWAIGIDKRWNVTYQLRDVIKPGGVLLFNGLWIPRIKGLTILDTFISCGFDCMMNVAIWTKYRKDNNSIEAWLGACDCE